MSTELPRRAKIQEFCIAEKVIYDAMQAVEAMPADVRLTDAVILLGAAKDSVADFLDGINERRFVRNSESASTISRIEGEAKQREIDNQEQIQMNQNIWMSIGRVHTLQTLVLPKGIDVAVEECVQHLESELTRLREAVEKIAVRTKELRDGQRGMCDAEWDHIQGLAEGRYSE